MSFTTKSTLDCNTEITILHLEQKTIGLVVEGKKGFLINVQ